METQVDKIGRQAKHCPYGNLLGLEVEEVAPGYARVAATVRPEHLNFLGRVHGGFIMSLADHVFAIAGNTVPGTYVAVQFNIHFIGTVRVGERLYAEGRVLHQGKYIGVVEMKVTDSSGRLVAEATGAEFAVERRSSQPQL